MALSIDDWPTLSLSYNWTDRTAAPITHTHAHTHSVRYVVKWIPKQ